MANILVTGGAGFIGSHLARRFVQVGHRVRVLDNLSTGQRERLADVAGRVDLLVGDLRNPGDCLAACDDVELVFHQAAAASVPRSVADPLMTNEVNAVGTLNLLLAARERRCRRVIYAGSSSVYGDSEVSPKTEDLTPNPLTPYAAQKLMGEHYMRVFAVCYGLETLTTRYFNVFGPGQDPASQYAAVIPAFVTAVLSGRRPIIYGDGEQTRDFTYIDNVLDGNLLAAEAPDARGQVLNIACGDGISVNEVLRTVNEMLGTRVPAEHVPPRVGDVRHSTAGIARAEKLLGYRPRIGFREGLQRTIAYYAALAKGHGA